MFRLEMLPAGHGDCLLLEYGEVSAPHRVLIDGGPWRSYDCLGPRLEPLIRSGQCLDLFVVSHVDTDHIDGAIKLLYAFRRGDQLGDVWFNAWCHLKPDRRCGSGPRDRLGTVHGEILSAVIRRRRLPWNAALGGGPVSLAVEGALPALPGGLVLTLLSPGPEDLLALDPDWDAEVRAAKIDPGSDVQAIEAARKKAHYEPPPDLLGRKKPDIAVLTKKLAEQAYLEELAQKVFVEDSSKTNRTGIAFLAEYEGKSCLCAADAHPRVLAESLERLCRARKTRRLKVDAVKLPHHGSAGNLSPKLLDQIDCKHFLISTNGGGGFYHPDPESIARLVTPRQGIVHLWFNYCNPWTGIWNKRALMQRYLYESHYPGEGQEGLMVPLSEL